MEKHCALAFVQILLSYEQRLSTGESISNAQRINILCKTSQKRNIRVLNNFSTISHNAIYQVQSIGSKLVLGKVAPVFLKINCAIFDFVANMWENVGMHMDGFFFSGSKVAKLDKKGRFVLPQEMRFGLVEEGKCEFVIGLGLGNCLAIYRKSAIQKIVARFQESQHIAKFQKFFTLFFSTLYPTECDRIGRVLLPGTLKSAVKIQDEIVIAGVMDKIELWPKEIYEENLRHLLEGKTVESLPKMMEEAFALLGEGERGAKEAIQTAMNPLYTSHHKG